MKVLLSALILSFSINAYAQSESVVATSRFAVAKGEDRSFPFSRHDFSVVEVELHQDGMLEVHELSSTDRKESLQLSKTALEQLMSEVQQLANAEIVQRYNQIVCMMMPGPVQSNDHLSVKREYNYQDGFLGKLELVDGPSGCWVSNKTFPKEQRYLTAAKVLKAQLKLMAIQLLDL